VRYGKLPCESVKINSRVLKSLWSWALPELWALEKIAAALRINRPENYYFLPSRPRSMAPSWLCGKVKVVMNQIF
jgi:hypothetical protein